MQKIYYRYLLSLICIFLFIIAAIANENPLNLILDTELQFSSASSDQIKQNIIVLDKNLNLSTEQKQKTENLALESAKKLNIYKVKFIDEKNKLISMRKKHAPLNQIQAQIKVLQSIKKRLKITSNQNIQDFEEILTTEQQKYLEEFKTELIKIKQNENHSKREINTVNTRENSLKALEPSE